MSNYTVTATRNGFVQGVHHSIRAASAQAACEIARMFYPSKSRGLQFAAREA